MPRILQHQCLCSTARQGRASSVSWAGSEWRKCYWYTELAPLFADLLQQKQKLVSRVLLVSLVSPNPSFSLFHQTSSVYLLLSKLGGLASAPQLQRQQLAKLRVLAQSHL